MTVIPKFLPSPITVYQGATYSQNLLLQNPGTPATPYNLTGKKAKCTARKNYYDETAIFELTTENGGITLGGTDGTVVLYMSASLTATFCPCGGVWDFELIDPSGDPLIPDIVSRILMADLVISPEVSRNG